ncbi:SapC family protein [Roseovarius aquimarinus]|uniref:SapC family protein n=1 Tax=Roseovarius aquimarinus TaxID=1229156 RepID=A0ABW7I6Z3_9RHOB
MTKQLLIYDKVVPVNRQTHRDVSVKRTTSFDFARDLNSLPIVDAEFARIALEMPIVFAKTDTGVVSLALLGASENRNAFVAKDGTWTGRYVPAFLRRYPFVFAVEEEGKRMTLCVDDSFSGLNEDNLGERLFDSEGTETTYLSTVLNFMEEYQATYNRTQQFCDRLQELDLLEEARIDYRLSDGKAGGVTGFLRVSNEKLRALPDDKIAAMFRSGDLDLIQLHLLSMHNAELLVSKSIEGDEAAGAEDGIEVGKAEEMGLN